MKVVSPGDFSHVTPLDRPVEKNEVVDVDDELGAQLLAQGWKAAPVKGAKGADKSEPAPEVAPSEEN